MGFELTPKENQEIAERQKTSNADLVSFTIKVMEISRGADFNDLDGMRERFLRYVQLCYECNMKVGNMGAYLAMGITRQAAEKWLHGQVNDKKKVEFMTWVHSVCAQYREAMMQEGTLKEITGIWWQKAFDGMRDNAPQQIAPANDFDREISADEILKKYADLPED